MKVYLISTYGENGSENVVATLDKSKVEALFEKKWGTFYDLDGPQYASGHPTMREKLKELLEKDEAGVDGTDLAFGWGGPQLHIIEFE